MKWIVCKDYQEMSRRAAEMVAQCLREDPNGLYSFPGGDTPLGFVREFVGLVNSGKADIRRASYVSLDEWVGLSSQDSGSCGYFNRQELLDALRVPFAHVHLIDGAAEDIEKERQALDTFIHQYGPLTVSVLGIGLNGHLGFNEEGSSFEGGAQVIPLSSTTKKVMGKYFDRERILTHGITQGIGQIMEAKTVILLANGEHKADIIRRALKGEVTPLVPASILQRHPNAYCILDEAAALEL